MNENEKTETVDVGFAEVDRKSVEALGRVLGKIVVFYIGYRLAKRKYNKPSINLIVINPPTNP